MARKNHYGLLTYTFQQLLYEGCHFRLIQRTLYVDFYLISHTSIQHINMYM